MSLDTGLIREVNERRFDPWIKGIASGGMFTPPNLPQIPNITKINVEEASVWIGVDIGHSPDPTSVVVVRHLRLESCYRTPGSNSWDSGGSYITSFYRVVRCHEWHGVSYPDQRGLMQDLINTELKFNKSLWLIVDATGVGKAVSQDWELGIQGVQQIIPVTMVYGQPRSIYNQAVSDLILNTQAAFQQGRVSLPKSPSQDQGFLIRKLQAQLTTRGIEEDFRGRLRAIDERKSGLNHYDLSVALSLVIGHNESLTSKYCSFRWV